MPIDALGLSRAMRCQPGSCEAGLETLAITLEALGRNSAEVYASIAEARPGPMLVTKFLGCLLPRQPPVHATGIARPTVHDVWPCSTISVWRPLENFVPDSPIAGRSTAAAPSTETEALSPIKRTAKRVSSQT
jgi:hypothetical protein